LVTALKIFVNQTKANVQTYLMLIRILLKQTVTPSVEMISNSDRPDYDGITFEGEFKIQNKIRARQKTIQNEEVQE
jgi:hypothetical protein